jgi:predicted  nucleic acid-binding Zn-ribbon protein
MKRTITFALSALLLAGFGLFTGCGGQESAPAPADQAPPADAVEESETVEQRPVTLEDVQRESAEAARMIWDYARERSADFRAAMAEEMEDVDERMAKLKERAAELSGEAREEMDRHIANLEVKRQAFQEQMGRISDNSGEAWEEVKAGIRKAYEDMSESLGRAQDELAAEPVPATPPTPVEE